MKELVVLAADRNMEYAVNGVLGRPEELRIRPIEWDSFVHPRRDPGCLNEAHTFLRPLATAYQHALVLFDFQGCGREDDAPDSLILQVRDRLARNGWGDRSEVILLVPELEVWVWSGSSQVERCLGWADRQPSLRAWLAAMGYWPEATPKPPDPKAAMEAALRHARKPRSSAIYLELAQTVSLHGHAEPAFRRFTQTLQRWFPA